MRVFILLVLKVLLNFSLFGEAPASQPKIYIAFLWQMHQPIYYHLIVGGR